MRTLSTAQAASVAGETTTLCRLCDLTLANGTTISLTDFDVDLIVGATTYHAAIGFEMSAIQTDVGTSTSNVLLKVLLDSATGLSRAAIEAGALDGATVEITAIDWTLLAEKIALFSGEVKLATYHDELYAELEVEPILSRDLMLSVDLFSSNCRYDLGDARCGVNIAALSKAFTVAGVADSQSFATSLTDADGAFDSGLITFDSGLNAGLAIEVQSYVHASGGVVLRLATPFALAVGDTGTAYPGCDKTLKGGCALYANQINFGGEPYLAEPAVLQGSLSGATNGTAVGGTTVQSGQPRTVLRTG